MALAVDTASSATANSGTVISWTHAGATSPSNYLVVVGVYVYQADVITISAITYGGQAMTLIGTTFNGYGTPNERCSQYGLINPPTGSQTVSITFTGTIGLCSAGAITFTGADQVIGWHNVATNASGGAATLAVTVTSAIGEMTTTVVGSDATTAPSTDKTLQWSRATFIEAGGDTAAGAATVTHTWTVASGGSGVVGSSIIPAASGLTTLGLQTPTVSQPPIFIQTW